MKNLVVFISGIIVIIFMSYSIWLQKNAEFKNNLPEAILIDTNSFVKEIPIGLLQKKFEPIPLLNDGNYRLNISFIGQMKVIYHHIFDSIEILKIQPQQINSTSLVYLDAATIIQLHKFQEATDTLVEESSKREKAILVIGLLLINAKEREYFINSYFLSDVNWKNQMKDLHLLLMKEPNNYFLHEIFIEFIRPAPTSYVLEYMKEVQFLDRGPTDEYYYTNPAVMERFPTSVLKSIVDKVDDYHWWAAYPERDAEQALLTILEKKKARQSFLRY